MQECSDLKHASNLQKLQANNLGSVDYHLRELEVAMDKENPKRILPSLTDTEDVILDIGCGIGQSFLGMQCTDRICFGIDIDTEAVGYGIETYGDKINYIVADAEKIPVRSSSFDLVFSRVALPYTNIPVVIEEINRVLRSNGRIWLTLHSRKMVVSWLNNALKDRKFRDLIYYCYVIVNGYLFKYTCMLFPYLNGRYESWQDSQAMIRLLAKHGFAAAEINVNQHKVIEGRLVTISEQG